MSLAHESQNDSSNGHRRVAPRSTMNANASLTVRPAAPITTTAQAIQDSVSLRRAALMHGIAYQTTLHGARAALEAIATAKRGNIRVASLQKYGRS
jgi:hypothetical protein